MKTSVNLKRNNSSVHENSMHDSSDNDSFYDSNNNKKKKYNLSDLEDSIGEKLRFHQKFKNMNFSERVMSLSVHDVFLFFKYDNIDIYTTFSNLTQTILLKFLESPSFMDELVSEYLNDMKKSCEYDQAHESLCNINHIVSLRNLKAIERVRKKITKVLRSILYDDVRDQRTIFLNWKKNFLDFITYITENCKLKFVITEFSTLSFTSSNPDTEFVYNMNIVKNYDLLELFEYFECAIHWQEKSSTNHIKNIIQKLKTKQIILNLTSGLDSLPLENDPHAQCFFENLSEILHHTQHIEQIKFRIDQYDFVLRNNGRLSKPIHHENTSINHKMNIIEYSRIKINLRRLLHFCRNTEFTLNQKYDTKMKFCGLSKSFPNMIETICDFFIPQAFDHYQIVFLDNIFDAKDLIIADPLLQKGVDVFGNMIFERNTQTISQSHFIEMDTHIPIKFRLNTIRTGKILTISGRLSYLDCDGFRSVIGIVTYDFIHMKCYRTISFADIKMIHENARELDVEPYPSHALGKYRRLLIQTNDLYFYFYNQILFRSIPRRRSFLLIEDNSPYHERGFKSMACFDLILELKSNIPFMFSEVHLENCKILLPIESDLFNISFSEDKNISQKKRLRLHRCEIKEDIRIEGFDGLSFINMREMNFKSKICEIRNCPDEISFCQISGIIKYHQLGTFILYQRDRSELQHGRSVSFFRTVDAASFEGLILDTVYIEISSFRIINSESLIITKELKNVTIDNSELTIIFKGMQSYGLNILYLNKKSRLSIKKEEDNGFYTCNFYSLHFDQMPIFIKQKFEFQLEECDLFE